MSKRILTVFLLVLAVLTSSSAFASRANLNVMGMGTPFADVFGRGSLFYDYKDNVFYNPSYANDFSNWATVEKSRNALGANAEGGFVMSAMGFRWGAYMNRGDAIDGLTDDLYGGGPIGAAALTNLKPVDLIFAGDTGIKWGLGVTLASNKIDKDTEINDITVRLGAQVMDFDPFIHYTLKGTYKAAGAEPTTKNFTIGTRYKFGDWTPFFVYRQNTIHVPAVGATAAFDVSAKRWGLGVGHKMKLADGIKLNYGVSYWRQSDYASPPAAGVGLYPIVGRTVLPISMALEGDLASWLTVRGGFSYNLYDRGDGGFTLVDDTNGRIGATIHSGKVDFDWALGHGAGVETTDGSGFGFDAGFFTMASATYHW